MTPAQLETYARRLYNAVNDTAFFTSACLYDFMADAISQFAMAVFEPVAYSSSVASVIATDGIALDANVIALTRITYAGQKLEKISKNELDQLRIGSTAASSGTPLYYYLQKLTAGLKLWLYPAPDTNGDTIAWEGYCVPAYPATSGTLDIPVIYHHGLVNWLLHMMCMQDEDAPSSDRYLVKWEKFLSEARITERRRNIADGFNYVKNEEDMPQTMLGII